jgi:hypothetical protein
MAVRDRIKGAFEMGCTLPDAREKILAKIDELDKTIAQYEAVLATAAQHARE